MKVVHTPPPNESSRLGTAGRRGACLWEELCQPGVLTLVYTDLDRAIVGSAVPGVTPLKFDAGDELRAQCFCERREIGVLNFSGKGLAEAGADLSGVNASLEPHGSAIETALTALARGFSSYQCDFADRRAVKDFAARVLTENGVPDILVNNAGTIRRAPAADHTDGMWFEVIDVNPNAQFLLSREIGARMIGRGSGKIIFTASLLTYQGGITVPGYAASKGAIGQLAKALSNEWASMGVQVNAIAPGLRRHRQHRSAAQRSRPPSADSRAHSRRALGRTRGFQRSHHFPRQRGAQLSHRRDPRCGQWMDGPLTISNNQHHNPVP